MLSSSPTTMLLRGDASKISLHIINYQERKGLGALAIIDTENLLAWQSFISYSIISF